MFILPVFFLVVLVPLFIAWVTGYYSWRRRLHPLWIAVSSVSAGACLLSPHLPHAHAAPLQETRPTLPVEAGWLQASKKAYKRPSNNPPGEPAKGDTSRPSLEVAYQALPPGDMAAVSVAYCGAMDSTGATQTRWINRMARAGHNGDKFTLTGPVEFLSQALEKVFLRDKNPAAIRVLMNLHLDGETAETLDYVRFPLFVRYPQPFVAVLRERSLASLRKDTARNHYAGFTGMLAYELTDDPALRHGLQNLAQKTHGQSKDDQFLRAYIRMILTASPPTKARKPVAFSTTATP